MSRMSVHISLLLGLGLFLLSTAAVAWMVRVLIAPQAGQARAVAVLPAQVAHPMESAQLSQAEQDAFADLVRQLPRGLRG